MGVMKTPTLVIAFATALQGVSVMSAAAQSGDERARSLQSAALNQLGILEYCQAQGMVGEAVVSAQRDTVQHLFQSQTLDRVDFPDEESGRAGFLAFGKRQGRFADSAAAQGLSLKAACEMRASATTGP